MRNLVKSLKNGCIDAVIGKPGWRRRLYQVVVRAMNREDGSENRSWQNYDSIYVNAKKLLTANPSWRYGAQNVHDTTEATYHQLSKHLDLVGKDYCELGCGEYHPYATSAILYCNGIRSSVATDILHTKDEPRAALALLELLLDRLAFPQKWLWSSVPVHEFADRARQFNLEALRDGDLVSGVSSIPIRHRSTDIYDPKIDPNSIDAMPDGVREQLGGRFRKMSDEELSIIRLRCVVRKPDQANK